MNYKIPAGIFILLAAIFLFSFSAQAHVPEAPTSTANTASEQGSSVNRGEEQQQAVVEQQILQTEREIREIEQELNPDRAPLPAGTENRIDEASKIASEVYDNQTDNAAERQRIIAETQDRVSDIQIDVSIAKLKEDMSKTVNELKNATPEQALQIQTKLQEQQRLLESQNQLKEKIDAANQNAAP